MTVDLAMTLPRRTPAHPAAPHTGFHPTPLLAALLLATGGLLLGPSPARADYSSGQAQQEKDFYNYGPDQGGRGKGGLLDSQNPIDLMNKLRRGTAMDEATNPSDAIDAALKALDQPPATAAPGPGAAVKAP